MTCLPGIAFLNLHSCSCKHMSTTDTQVPLQTKWEASSCKYQLGFIFPTSCNSIVKSRHQHYLLEEVHKKKPNKHKTFHRLIPKQEKASHTSPAVESTSPHRSRRPPRYFCSASHPRAPKLRVSPSDTKWPLAPSLNFLRIPVGFQLPRIPSSAALPKPKAVWKLSSQERPQTRTVDPLRSSSTGWLAFPPPEKKNLPHLSYSKTFKNLPYPNPSLQPGHPSPNTSHRAARRRPNLLPPNPRRGLWEGLEAKRSKSDKPQTTKRAAAANGAVHCSVSVAPQGHLGI